MLFISSNSNDPYINLALEEYLIYNKEDEVCVLWQNSPAIIVGKNQNTMAEIDYEYVTENKIPVVRRLSGGGTVFHDLGNLNFTYIVNKGEFGDYVGFTKTLRDYINSLGAHAEMSGRNDVLVEGRKISGNAQYLWKNRLLHHGTVLINADLSSLAAALRPDESKIQSKGIKSIKSRVANLSEFIQISTGDFRSGFERAIKAEGGVQDYTLSHDEWNKVLQLADEKYRTYEWCFGYSPRYSFHKKERFAAGGVEIFMDIKDGIIEDIKIFGDFFTQKGVDGLADILKGTPHEYESLSKIISNVEIDAYISGLKKEEFLSCMI
ncbi:MAG: lipoate--protein ligase [Firmicutes bacterium]|nr:lipoate--protein ligase [Bacillota bacterium]